VPRKSYIAEIGVARRLAADKEKKISTAVLAVLEQGLPAQSQ